MATSAGKSGGNAGAYERQGDVDYKQFGVYYNNDDSIAWFDANGGLFDPDSVSDDEKHDVISYTGSSYGSINHTQYTKPWEDIKDSSDSNDKYYADKIVNIHNALSNVTLNHGIEVNRAANFKIFGKKTMTMAEISKVLDKSNGVVQVDGFMSASTKPNGVAISGSGLVLHFRIPPSTGAGAYVGNVSLHESEQEYVVNNNSVWQFDKSSMHKDSQGRIHITGYWLGQNAAQTISPTFKKPRVSKGKKK